MTPVEILSAARALVNEPSRWCRRYLARNAAGERVRLTSPEAVAWSIWGATGAVSELGDEDACAKADEALEHVLFERCGYPATLDVATHREALEVFDDAIALLSAEARP